jgi:hypothetical protein
MTGVRAGGVARGVAGLVALAAATLAGPQVAAAAALGPTDAQDLRRAVEMVGASASEEPAVRRERETREPSAGFMLGAALAAWTNAAAILRYDLETPSGDGDDSEAIAIDCFDERTAFDHLEARVRTAALTAPYLIDVAHLSGVGRDAAWLARRRSGQPERCR